MKEQTIRVIKVSPMRTPEVVTLTNELRELQKAVSIEASYVGYIECLYMEDGVDLLLNEEGKLINLPLNRIVDSDIICGTFYVVGVDEESGEFCSLNEQQIEKYTKRFARLEHFGPAIEERIRAMFC